MNFASQFLWSIRSAFEDPWCDIAKNHVGKDDQQGGRGIHHEEPCGRPLVARPFCAYVVCQQLLEHLEHFVRWIWLTIVEIGGCTYALWLCTKILRFANRNRLFPHYLSWVQDTLYHVKVRRDGRQCLCMCGQPVKHRKVNDFSIRQQDRWGSRMRVITD